MALPSSGAISLSDVNVELGLSATALITMNDSAVRTLFGLPSGLINMSTGHGKSNHIPFSTKVTFTNNISWTVPSGVTAIRVKVWGGAGASNLGASALGGAGGYAQADIPVTAGETLLIAVGGGGVVGTAQITVGARNGGGVSAKSGNYVSGGGGFSGIFINNTISQANAKVIAGGGGSGFNNVAVGGAGGGMAGVAGGGGTTTGGTQTAGGTGSKGNGSALQGGIGNYTTGGGGFFGGGGSAGIGNTAGSAGGSGFLASGLTNTTLTAGNGVTPPNTSDADYVAGKAVGGSNSAGGEGFVVVYY